MAKRKPGESGGWAVRDSETGKFTESGTVGVVRTIRMPDGKTLRVMRKDAFDRAITKSASRTK